MKRLLWCAALVSISISVAGRPALRPQVEASDPRRAERPVPFSPGESLSYDVAWARYVTAGYATVSVQAKRPSLNSVAYYIVAEGRPSSLLSYFYKLYYKADTLLDVYTLLPQRSSVYAEEGDERVTKTTHFDQTARTARFEVKAATTSVRKFSIPAECQDALSIVYAIRTLPLKKGTTRTIPLVESGDIYRLRVRVDTREAITTPLGQQMAWRLTPDMLDELGRSEGRQLTLWLSDDEKRLPLKMEARLPVGSFTFTLRQVKLGR